MTLSIIWRSEGRLHLASDSRMSFGASSSVDVGVKVMRLPIRVIGTSPDQTGDFNVLFERTFGFSYAGSVVNAASFKHLIEDLLVDVQYVPADIPLSFEELCNYFCDFSAKVSTEIVSRLAENGQYTFLVAGLCPNTAVLRGARFQLVQDAGRTTATFVEVVQSDGEYVAVGSGADEFDRLFQGRQATLNSVLLTLNQIIDEGAVPSVGGGIQYGTFDKNADFNVAGITRISVEEADVSGQHFGPSEQRVHVYRGFELYSGWGVHQNKLWPSPTFVELAVPSNPESNLRFLERCREQVFSNS